MEPNKIQTSLPENAYRELKPGEAYTPVMPASSNPKEVTPYSVTMGIIMAVVFSAAAAFLGLKVGQVFEAAIPIASPSRRSTSWGSTPPSGRYSSRRCSADCWASSC